MKGLLFVELSVRESIRESHSSLAVLIKNPVWRLIEAIQSLRDSHGKILIKNWYKEVTPFTKKDLEIIDKEPFDGYVFKKEFGIKSFIGNKKKIDAKKALVGEPTCNVAGIISGYTGEGAKTVIPAKALVKVDFRLVPKMDPKKQIIRLKKHLKSKGFNDVDIKIFHAEAASRTDSSNPFVSQIKDAADKSFGNSILNVSNAGTGPMYSFTSILKSPCVSIGSTYMFSRIHSPNEFTRLDLLNKTTKCIYLIMHNFGKS